MLKDYVLPNLNFSPSRLPVTMWQNYTPSIAAAAAEAHTWSRYGTLPLAACLVFPSIWNGFLTECLCCHWCSHTNKTWASINNSKNLEKKIHHVPCGYYTTYKSSMLLNSLPMQLGRRLMNIEAIFRRPRRGEQTAEWGERGGHGQDLSHSHSVSWRQTKSSTLGICMITDQICYFFCSKV